MAKMGVWGQSPQRGSGASAPGGWSGGGQSPSEAESFLSIFKQK